MRSLILGIIFGFALGACSSSAPSRHQPAPPAQVLEEFFDAVSEKRYGDTLDKLAANTLREIKEDAVTQQDVDKYFAFTSTIRNAVAKKIGTYEEIGSESACLTTVGYSGKGDPVSLSVAFLFEKERWKINHLHVFYPQSQQELPVKATCPLVP